MSTRDTVRRWLDIGPDRPYECVTCGEQYVLEHYVCPGCGGFSVERRLE